MEIKPIEIQSTDIRISGPSIIPTIEPPVVQETQVPVVRGLAIPIFDIPDYSVKYPTIDVPTQEEFDAAVRADREKQAQEQQDKARGLPDTKALSSEMARCTSSMRAI